VPNIIEIKNIVKRFPQNGEENNTVLKGVSFDVYPGDFIVIIGANGSGKSTLLNCIAGATPLDDGEIWIDNNNITLEKNKAKNKRISRVLQDPKLGTVGSMTLLENLRIAFLRNKTKSPIRRMNAGFVELAKEKIALLKMGLENNLNKRMDQFSGGQRQAICLIMSIIEEPDLLLMDEPSSALDPKSSIQLLEIANQLTHKLAIKTIMITHNFKEAIHFGNKLMVLKNGTISKLYQGEEKKSLSSDFLFEQI